MDKVAILARWRIRIKLTPSKYRGQFREDSPSIYDVAI